jgi:hypothetical protein
LFLHFIFEETTLSRQNPEFLFFPCIPLKTSVWKNIRRQLGSEDDSFVIRSFTQPGFANGITRGIV